MGGCAFPMSTMITQENVQPTYDKFSVFLNEIFGIQREFIQIIGSAGKKGSGELSGDIDVVVDSEELRRLYPIKFPASGKGGFLDDLAYYLKRMGVKYRDFRQIGVFSVLWPITTVDGSTNDCYVQIDVMPSSVKWATWSYYSPWFHESNYKGLYRNEIMYAVAKYARFVKIDEQYWTRLFFDLGRGLLIGKQKYKSPKVIETLGDKFLISRDPQEVINILFGENKYRPEDLLTWEQAYRAIMEPDFVHREFLKDILNMVKKGIEKKKMPLPTELQES